MNYAVPPTLPSPSRGEGKVSGALSRVPTFVDLPVDAADAEARFRALPPGASMVYARGEHRGPAGQKMLDLCTQGRALLVQRRVGPVEAMCRDYIAIKSVRA